MFRDIRRSRQTLPLEEGKEMLDRNTAGVLSLRDDEYPYGVPLSYAYDSVSPFVSPELGTVYVHCATKGHKLDAIALDGKVSFCVIDQDKILPDTFTTAFRSTIVFGKARLIEDDKEKRHGLELLTRKYSPGLDAAAAQEIDGSWNHTCVIAIDIEHMSAKEAIELVREREPKA